MIRRQRFSFNWQIVLALGLVAIYVAVAIAAPWLAPQADPAEPSAFRLMEGVRPSSLGPPRPPNPAAPLGTAPGGWDILYSLIWGARPVLRFGLLTALTTGFVGVMIGAVSGYLEGRINQLVMRIVDAFLAFPAIAGIVLFRQILTPAGPDVPPNMIQRVTATLSLDPVMLALILFSWMPYTRIIAANVSALKHVEYGMAARTVGVGPLRIIFRHLLPNAIAPAIVLVARDIGGMVILEAAFTFIGIGAGLPWGTVAVAGRDWVIGPGGNPLTYWWVFVPVTLVLILFSVAWNLLGDGLNTVLNPRSGRSLRRVR